MNRPYRVIKTVKKPLTVAAVDLEHGEVGQVRLFSNRPFHFAVGAVATSGHTPVAAGKAEYIASLAPNELLSAVLADGEIDGSIWVSYIQFSQG